MWLLHGSSADARAIGNGRLADVAPTLIQLLGLQQPADMTGRSLINAGRSDAAGTMQRAIA